MKSPSKSTPLNWVQLLATPCIAIAPLALPLWWVSRGEHNSLLILAGAILFASCGGALWFLGWIVARQQAKAEVES